MNTNNSGYKINEKDIESVINFLKTKDPGKATPEMAIEILERLQAKFHEMAHMEPELLDQIYEDLQKDKNN